MGAAVELKKRTQCFRKLTAADVGTNDGIPGDDGGMRRFIKHFASITERVICVEADEGSGDKNIGAKPTSEHIAVKLARVEMGGQVG